MSPTIRDWHTNNPTEGITARMARSEETALANGSLAKVRKALAKQELVTIFSNLENRKMPPLPENETGYGDDNMSQQSQVPLETKSSFWSKRTIFGDQIKHVSKRLFQALPCGNKQPKLGQMCLIMKGKVGCDEGQMAIVSERTPVMVRVTYVCNQRGMTRTKLKQPSSLIMLDPNVTLVQEKDGTMWIRPCA